MKKVTAVFRPERLADVATELEQSGITGFTISDVRGHGHAPEKTGEWRGRPYELHVTHKLEIEIIVEDEEVQTAVAAVIRGARTGQVGDGLITVSDIAAVYQIRTGMPGAPSPNAVQEAKT